MTQPPRPGGLLESDGVLERFLTDMVVDDYAAVPDRADRADRERRPGWAAAGVIAIIGILVAVVVVNVRATDDERRVTREALITRVEEMQAGVDARKEQVDQQSASVDSLQQTLLALDPATTDTGQMADLAARAGTTVLSGPGVTVTIDDAVDAEAGSLNRVLDRDLQDIVNVLWQMGAVGVAVNDQRLTALTAIRGAGEAILVNYQPLTRPYRVTAIGTATSGDEGSGLTGLLDGLASDYGLVSDVSTGDVALPAGELRVPRFAETIDEGGGS